MFDLRGLTGNGSGSFEVVQVDKIYRIRNNLAFCKEHGIRLSGPPLDRPQLDSSQEKKILCQDMREYNAVESIFGICKRRYGLARIMARFKETAESVVSLQFLVINLERRLQLLYRHFICAIFRALKYQSFSVYSIIEERSVSFETC